jgi:hypothetical protein
MGAPAAVGRGREEVREDGWVGEEVCVCGLLWCVCVCVCVCVCAGSCVCGLLWCAVYVRARLLFTHKGGLRS